MIEPRPIIFDGDWGELQLDGVPVIEAAHQAFVGRCQECGSLPEDQYEGTILTNLVEFNGTLYGDAFCAGCLHERDVEGPVFALPPLWDESLDEGGE